MNIFIKFINEKAYIAFILLFLIPLSAFCQSDFKVAYLVDDQIITNYDIDQSKRLRNLLTNSNLGRSEVEKIIVDEKIKEIYANRLKIVASNAELEAQLDDFLKSNKISIQKLKSLMRSKGIDIETFYNFIKAKISWQKVLDSRFGYKINNLQMQDAMPLIPSLKKIEKEYEFSEIFISYKRWGVQRAALIAKRLEIELKAGADFDAAVKKFSSAKSKINKGKVGPIKKSSLSKEFRDVLDKLKKNDISRPLEVNGGLLLLKLDLTRSYKNVRTPKVYVIFSITNTHLNQEKACSDDKEIRGPILLSKVEKKIREPLIKLMPGESYKLSDKSGLLQVVTLCDSFIKENKNATLSYKNMKKNEEAIRLGNALMLELRRNTTIIKK